jgi:rubrerythrin
MKNLLILLFCFCALTNLKAQSDSIVKNRTNELLKKQDKEPIRDPMYCCRKCNYTSTKAGTCPVDKISLIKEGMYFCPEDGTTKDLSGNCPKCGRKMKKMEMPAHEG